MIMTNVRVCVSMCACVPRQDKLEPEHGACDPEFKFRTLAPPDSITCKIYCGNSVAHKQIDDDDEEDEWTNGQTNDRTDFDFELCIFLYDSRPVEYR